MQTRRDFNSGLASLAFGGLALAGCSKLEKIEMLPDALARTPGFRRAQNRRWPGFGGLQPDPNEVPRLDLPKGFTYQIVSSRQDKKGDKVPMDDEFWVPNKADGMGSFRIDEKLMVLVRNHELDRRDFLDGPFDNAKHPELAVFDRSGGKPLPGGTTTIIYDYRERQIVKQHLSLAGTVRNCAGGVTPWGTWLTCEEPGNLRRRLGDKPHGWVFEVPPLHDGMVAPVALEEMGRFNHEAAAVDPQTGIVYMTEDRYDGLFYRFIPNERTKNPADGTVRARLAAGGKLQALALAGDCERVDARNWSREWMPVGLPVPVRWVDLTEVDSPKDDLRKRGHDESQATLFANGEGLHFGFGELFICASSGGAIKSGQVFRYRPSAHEGEDLERDETGTLELFLESNDPATFNFGDNLAVAPNGHLVVCEDPYWGGQKTFLPRMVDASAPCFLRGVTPDGAVYNIARLHGKSEFAGACFAPDGRTLFVNIMSPAVTVAIWADEEAGWGDSGPWGPPLPGWRIYQAAEAV